MRVAHRIRMLMRRGAIHQVLPYLSDGHTKILDIGYGFGNHWAPIGGVPQHAHCTAIEAAESWAAKTVYPENVDVIIGTAPQVLGTLGSNSFDVVIAFDLIEHLSKEDGYRLVYEMERIARRICVIFTPNGHVWQPPRPDNSFDAHLSGWTP